MGRPTLDTKLLSGFDHVVAFCIRLWEFGTHLATIHSLSPRYARLIGCPAMALGPFTTPTPADQPAASWRHALLAGLLKGALILLLVLVAMPLAFPLAALGLVLRVLLHPCKGELAQCPSPATPSPAEAGAAAERNGRDPVHLFSLNAALSEFEIMNAINGLRTTPIRRKELWEFLLGALRPMPDFFCLQEVFSPGAVAYLQRQFHGVGYHVVAQTRPKSPIGMSSGLFIASRHRVCATRFVAFAHCAGEDALAKKGVLLLEVAVGTRWGIIGTTHLQAAGPNPTRVAQLQEAVVAVTDFVDTCQRAAGNPAAFVLLAGDFNSGAGSPDTALWPFVTGQEAPFLLLTSPGPAHATALNVRSRAALDFAVNVQQQLWVLGPKANFHGTPKPTARDQLLLYALGTFDIQRPTLDFGNEQTEAAIARVDYLDPMLYVKPHEGPIDHVLALRRGAASGAVAEAAYGVPFGAGGICSDHLYVNAVVTFKGV